MTHLNMGKEPAPYTVPLARLGARQHQSKIDGVNCILRGDVTRWAQTISRTIFSNDEDAAAAHREVVEWCKTLPVAVVKGLMIDAWELGVDASVRAAAVRSYRGRGPSKDPEVVQAKECRAHRRLRGRRDSMCEAQERSAVKKPRNIRRLQEVAAGEEAAQVDLGVCELRDAGGRKAFRAVCPSTDDYTAEMECAFLCAEMEAGETAATSLAGTYGVTVNLQERVRAAASVWRRNGAVPVVLQWITEGYDLFWLDGAPGMWACRGNHEGARAGSAPQAHLEFLRAQLPELLKMGALKIVSEKPRWLSPLNVVPKATPGKFRMILDLRELNSYLAKWPFKMETLQSHRSIFRRDRWMVGVDLKSAYHHIGIHPDCQSYFGCEFDGVYYEWTALCFGLSSAPFAFTKCMRQIARHFRQVHGYDMMAYLDDFVFVFDTRAEATAASGIIKSTFADWGLLTCPEKSTWVPTQRLKVLGFVIDLVAGKFIVPESRRVKIVQQARSLLSQDRVPVRDVASVAGRISSCHLVLGYVAIRYCRGLFRTIETKQSWWSKVALSEEARQELQFWIDNIDGLRSRDIHLAAPVITRRAASDASDSATGAWLRTKDGMRMAREDLSEDERLTSSTLRELLGIERGLVAFGAGSFLNGQTVQWRTDSQAAFFALRRGSGKLWIDEVVKRIHGFCVGHGICLVPLWVPRTANEFADWLSKVEDDSDYALDRRIFDGVAEFWGPFDVDRFASRHNALCSRFNARWYCRDAEAVDAFTQDWSGDNNWVNPPFSQMGKVLSHMRMCKAGGTVLVPQSDIYAHLPWHTSIFGPASPSWVREKFRLEDTDALFWRGGVVVPGAPCTDYWVVRVDFTGS